MSLGIEELELAKDLIKELRKSREVKERVEIEEIDARDRVNISLKMYEEMRNKIQECYEDNKKLLAEVDAVKDSVKDSKDIISLLLLHLDIPFDQLKIDPTSIVGFVNRDMTTGKDQYMIKFTSEV